MSSSTTGNDFWHIPCGSKANRPKKNIYLEDPAFMSQFLRKSKIAFQKT